MLNILGEQSIEVTDICFNRRFDGNAPPKVSGTEESKIEGAINWTSPDGQTNTLGYTADENGFQPTNFKDPFA